MHHRLVKTFTHKDQSRRVSIHQRDDGLFSFNEERRIEFDEEYCAGSRWVLSRTNSGLYETAETAEREALLATPWLSQAEISN